MTSDHFIVACLLFPGSSVSPHLELPQGQMDSLLSIISSQRERFRSRNQELEAVSRTLRYSCACVRVSLCRQGLISHLSVSFLLQENRSMQQTMQALQNELDSLRADSIKLYEKIKFLQSYPGRVRQRVCGGMSGRALVSSVSFFKKMSLGLFSLPFRLEVAMIL